MLLFILLAYLISEEFALKYALVIVGALQLISLPLAQHIIKEIDTKHQSKPNENCDYDTQQSLSLNIFYLLEIHRKIIS